MNASRSARIRAPAGSISLRGGEYGRRLLSPKRPPRLERARGDPPPERFVSPARFRRRRGSVGADDADTRSVSNFGGGLEDQVPERIAISEPDRVSYPKCPPRPLCLH